MLAGGWLNICPQIVGICFVICLQFEGEGEKLNLQNYNFENDKSGYRVSICWTHEEDGISFRMRKISWYVSTSPVDTWPAFLSQSGTTWPRVMTFPDFPTQLNFRQCEGPILPLISILCLSKGPLLADIKQPSKCPPTVTYRASGKEPRVNQSVKVIRNSLS